MKTLIAFVVTIFLLPDQAFSQCAYLRDEYDEIYKRHELITEWHQISYPNLLKAKVDGLFTRITKDETSFFSIGIGVSNSSEIICVGANSALYFLFEDGNVLELEPNDVECLEYSSGKYSGVFYFSIDEEDLERLRDLQLKAVRLRHRGGVLEPLLIGKKMEKSTGVLFFRNGARCIIDK